MCLIVLGINAHPKYPLIIAANRDEFFNRPTQALHAWPNSPIIAGRDEQLGGTWLGITQNNRIAMVTNYRAPGEGVRKPKSRGHLVSEFLTSTQDPLTYTLGLQDSQDDYAGYNLIVGEGTNLVYFSNRSGAAPVALPDGVHGLSNHLLNSPWPKTEGVKQGLATILGDEMEQEPLTQALFHLLSSDEKAAQDTLPITGIDPAREHSLSSIFVKFPDQSYGTRCSSVILKEQTGRVAITERSWSAVATKITESVLTSG